MVKEKKQKNKIIRRILWTLAGLLVFTAISIAIVLHIVLTPERVTPIVLKFANDYLDKAEVNCESVEITFFRTFPNLGILLKNGNIINHSVISNDSLETKLPQDTLIAFQSCLASFNPVAFLSEKKIIIHKLEIKRPNIYAFVDTSGKANWDIIPADENDTDTLLVKDKKVIMQRPQLNMKNLHIQDAIITFDDRKQNIFVIADSLQLGVKGNMSNDSSDLDLKLGVKALTSMYEDQIFTKDLSFEITAKLRNNRIRHRLTIEQALISVGILKLNANGALQRDSLSQSALVDVDFKLHAASLSELLEMIPTHISDIKDQIITTGEIDSHGKLKGRLGKNSYPLLSMNLLLKNGSLRSSKHPEKSGLKKIEIDCNALFDLSTDTPSYVHINNILLESASSKIKCSGVFEDIFTKPFISTDIKGEINFTRMSQDFTFTKDMTLGGLIKLNLDGKCFLEDILAGNYGKIYANGEMDIDDVIVKYPGEGIDMFATLVKLRLGSNVKDSIRGIERESLLRGNIEMDSINMNWKNDLLANAGKLSVRFHTSAPADTNTIAVMSTMAGLENLRLTMGDSIRIRAVKTGASLRLAPLKENHSKPELSARITIDSLRGRMPGFGGRVNYAKLALKIKHQETPVNQQFRQQRTGSDSILRAQRIDSVRRQSRESILSFQLESNEMKDALRKWDISGTFECKYASTRTPYFPLHVQISESSLGFTNNTLSLKKTHIKAGSSDMILTGEIEGIRRALLRSGRMEAKISLDADSIDINELIRASVTGSEYAGKDIYERDSISKAVLDDTKNLAIQADTTPPGIFVVPRNVDLEFKTNMKNARYAKLYLNKASGNIIIRNQSIHLSDLNISSEVGNARISLAYKAPDLKGAHLGLDLQMYHIHIKELISAFPLIDSLAPMLRSFEGVVDCNMAAVTELDSLSEIILPKTTASCYLSGINMVLLDGETFTEISKMLMFKNKNKNLIDSIAVEMILENSKIMVFPFHVSLDRYSAGIGGTQNLDMSFDYHISVLKSPLPFKIGLNLTGTMDKMKYKIVKPKYKDLFTPAKERSLASTHINIRRQMHESLQRSIDEIINEPLESPVRRPQIALSDSLKQAFFEMDTVSYNPVPDSIQINPEPATP